MEYVPYGISAFMYIYPYTIIVKNSHEDELAAAREAWASVQCVEPILPSPLRSPLKEDQCYRSPLKDDPCLSPKKHLNNSSSSSPAKSPSIKQPLQHKTHLPSLSAPPGVRITPHTDFDEVWDFFTRQDMSDVMVSQEKLS